VKILVVTDRLAPLHAGGAARVAAALAHEYGRAGHEVVVAHASTRSAQVASTRSAQVASTRSAQVASTSSAQVASTRSAPGEEEIEGIRARRVEARISARRRGRLSIRNPRALGQLRTIVADEKPDVAHAHNVHEAFSFAALEVLAGARVPTVLTLHDCMTFHQGKFVEIARRPGWQGDDAQLRVTALDLLRRYRFRYVPGRRRRIRAIIERSGARVVAASGLLRRALAANGVPCHAVIHNGIRAEEFRAAPEAVEELRARLGLGGRRVVATFGRLTREKGQAQVLGAMRHVRRDVPEAVLLTVGTPPGVLPEGALAEGAPLVVGTEPLGGGELAAAYGLADVVAVPSVCLDVFPTVALEAMAAGRPVVVSRFAGTSEIVEDGETGVIVDPRDVGALAEAVLKLLRDEARAARMGEAAQELVEAQFTIEECAGRYIELLDEVAGSRRG
jgi:glycosyltransferase involved in cell wall biosynthesis